MRDNPEIHVVSRDRRSTYASAAYQAAPQAIQIADRFHVTKNLTEATQLLLARCQAEMAAGMQEPIRNENGQPTLSIEEWRPKEPAHVKKVRLQRRAGREARYEQVVKKHEQGLTAKEMACQLDRSRTDSAKMGGLWNLPRSQKTTQEGESL